MRFKIFLQSGKPEIVPLNYQYPLSAWMYKTFTQADRHFAHWLHEHGYAFNGNRKFKLFTFSWLTTPNAQMLKRQGALKVRPGNNHFYVSFHMEEAASHFISGLFREQELVIAGPGTKGSFTVSRVERMPDPVFENGTAVFQCLSPVNVSKPREENGKLRAQYIDPHHPEYSELLHANLLRRYAAKNKSLVGMMADGLGFEALADFPFDTSHWKFELLNKPQKRGQKIKEGTPKQTQVIGYSYRFKLEAPRELLKFAWDAGIGEKGSLGFGCVDQLKA